MRSLPILAQNYWKPSKTKKLYHKSFPEKRIKNSLFVILKVTYMTMKDKKIVH